jgi:hypothetical protein
LDVAISVFDRKEELVKTALIIATVATLFLGGNAYAADAEARGGEVRVAGRAQNADEISTVASPDYPAVSADQSRPDRTATEFDCASPCIQPYKCDVWTDSCVSQPVFGGCYIAPGRPPCVCWDSTCL